MSLTNAQVEQFIADGFIRLDNAFPHEVADAGRAILWRETGCDPHDARTWTKPVIRLNGYADEPFQQAVNTPLLHAAFDQLVGVGRWKPRDGLGTFPIRFPHPDDPGDAGWHIDASFADERADPNDFFSWRVNVFSKGRALLMLFLFSDVGEHDAPTRIRVGSHLEMPRWLESAGEAGVSFLELDAALAATAKCPLALATGAAGTVYLCHPFLVHAAQIHRGTTPRFLAQPPLYPAEPIQLHRNDGEYSPVETAIRLGLRWK